MGERHLLGAFGFRVSLLRAPVVRASASFKVGDVDVTASVGVGRVRLADGGFAECSGLEVEMDVHELLVGGVNDGVTRLVGRGKYQNLVLKRGMLFAPGGSVDAELWRWLQDIVRGVRPVRRCSGVVEVLDRGHVVARWEFTGGLPVKLAGPQLNAQTGQIALEELHIAHQGLVLR